MTIKYRYALSSNNSLVDVNELIPSERYDHAPYSCLGCTSELVPHLGKIRTKHFVHKHEQPCSSETYLHRLAKQTFFDTYTSALANNQPFFLNREIQVTCNYYEQDFGFTCHRNILDNYDLTRYFDRIGMEQPIGNYRADILLSSSHSSEVILIEFAVSHHCEDEKVASGYRIIEFTIQDEENIDIFKQHFIGNSEHLHQIELYNFRVKNTVRHVCNGKCNQRVNVFLVYPSKKSVLVEAAPSDILKGKVGKTATHYELLGITSNLPYQMNLYRQKVREAHFAGVPIRNCFLCKYHGADGVERAIFCRLHKESCSSNQAVECNEYRPLPSMEACNEADAVNDEYLRKNRHRMLARRMLKDFF